ncbi:MAG: hypothetical protein WBD23_15220 [Candidatus Acidiferrales bacterium]
MNLFSNPVIVRNARIQLRPRKLLIAGGICAAISVAMVYFILEGNRTGFNGVYDGQELLKMTLWIQAIVLVFGGGIACLHAVQREKDQNTFDSQRLTRLSPWELTLGKLFGPPLMAYFIFLCFLPAAIIGAAYARSNWTIVLAAYTILILGAIVFDALALVISLYLRRGTVTWAILAFLAIVYESSFVSPGAFLQLSLGPVGPFSVIELAARDSWSLASQLPTVSDRTPFSFRDLFFGLPLHHALVLSILYLTLLTWFLTAAVRNIKRDPENYELYTTGPAMAFLCYLNFILLAFFRWDVPSFSFVNRSPQLTVVPIQPLAAQSLLLTANIALFFIFGFLLLRNRVRMRRRLHSAEAAPVGLESMWPVPYIFVGALVVGAAMIGVIDWKRDPSLEWSLAVAVYRVIFFFVWLSIDLLFLQWMNLRRGRHPLALGVLLLGVYYVCAVMIVTPLHWGERALTAILLPTPLFVLNASLWSSQMAEWIIALAVEIAVAVVFILLRRRQLAELQPQPHPSPVSMNAPAPSASL